MGRSSGGASHSSGGTSSGGRSSGGFSGGGRSSGGGSSSPSRSSSSSSPRPERRREPIFHHREPRGPRGPRWGGPPPPPRGPRPYRARPYRRVYYRDSGCSTIFAGIVLLIIIGLIISVELKKDNPRSFLDKVSSNQIYVDGADTTYYVYTDKIIVESIMYYPVGMPDSITYERTITSYNNLNISSCENCNRTIDYYRSIISGKTGKIKKKKKK